MTYEDITLICTIVSTVICVLAYVKSVIETQSIVIKIQVNLIFLSQSTDQ